jgi:hypothetical protein
VIPTVASRHPLWESRLRAGGARSSVDQGLLLDTGKETIGTSAMNAHPDMILEMPRDSFAPFLLALGTAVLFVGLLLRQGVTVGVGTAIAALALLFWLWPRQELGEREAAHG